MANQPNDRERMRNDLRELARLAKPSGDSAQSHRFESADSSGYVDLSAFSASDSGWVDRELARAKAGPAGAEPRRAPPPLPGSGASAKGRAIDVLSPESMAPVALESFLVTDGTAKTRISSRSPRALRRDRGCEHRRCGCARLRREPAGASWVTGEDRGGRGRSPRLPRRRPRLRRPRPRRLPPNHRRRPRTRARQCPPPPAGRPREPRSRRACRPRRRRGRPASALTRRSRSRQPPRGCRIEARGHPCRANEAERRLVDGRHPQLGRQTEVGRVTPSKPVHSAWPGAGAGAGTGSFFVPLRRSATT